MLKTVSYFCGNRDAFDFLGFFDEYTFLIDPKQKSFET